MIVVSSTTSLVLYGYVLGMLVGAWVMLIAELRARRGARGGYVVWTALAVPILYGAVAESLGWWTPGSWGHKVGLLHSTADAVLVASVAIATAIVAMLVLGVMLRALRNSGRSPRSGAAGDR